MMKQILALCLVLAVSSFGFSLSEPAHTDYEVVIPSQSSQVLGPVGGAGDVLERLVVDVITSATGTVILQDGTRGIINVTPPNTPVGVYSVIIGARSASGAWKVTTGAGASVIGIGRFQ